MKKQSRAFVSLAVVRAMQRMFRALLIVLAMLIPIASIANDRDAAIAILKDQTSDYMSDQAGQALGRKAANVAMMYSKDFDSLFGTYNATYLTKENRATLQSWASGRARYWGGG